ncbi:hypothetical protein LELG_01630 [Lodderomyces elongisporus NRRL YB-4239]|uniref:Septin-type G domain-containing protein n=1 Tax=Lodderomyces elongisporus (strain ATCC 11503 / CBS 2605 / JCM 1781 / NBRC 1676 / NRRL YB-4239) TaxID=379508 RepID=A5DW94_LODEL|nr:hypothetical protein LELG_01630 [Lodderomyces elongisporus NRRL YB-4239]
MDFANESSFMNNGNHHSPIINYRKDAKKGVKFTFMVVGELGTGKTTFINSLLDKKVMRHRYETDYSSSNKSLDPSSEATKVLSFTSAKSVALPNTSMLTRNAFNPSTIDEEPGIALTETKVEIVDDENLKIMLTIIDTPGFGENLNNELCFVEIENYLKQQFDLVLAEETRIKRNPRFTDTRVHVMLYFITPTGHGLREIDVQCMKRLSKYVNIIPVIGKADSFTAEELQFFKHQIRIDIEKFNVPIFQFDSFLNDYDEDEDYDLIQECKFLSNLQPFAVVTSEDSFEVKDTTTGETKIIRARRYPWGLVNIEDTRISDFTILRSVLLGSHLQDLKDLTHDFLYETYRTERLTKVTGGNTGLDEDEYEDSEFHDTVEHHPQNQDERGFNNSDIPSMSNLAQLTNAASELRQNSNGHNHHYNNNHNNTSHHTSNDNESVTSSSSSVKKSSSMLLEDNASASSSPQLRNYTNYTGSTSTLSTEDRAPNNNAFKRLSIGPQRNQLRQISETVPYVLRHERILERQQKLEEMEMASAKELATRAALLEKKAQELKQKERELIRQLELAKQNSISKLSHASDLESRDRGSENVEVFDAEYDEHGQAGHHIPKDETLTNLHDAVANEGQL